MGPIEAFTTAWRKSFTYSGKAIRAEYAQLLSSFKITNLPPRQRDSFRRRKTKAVKAVERDEAQQRLEV